MAYSPGATSIGIALPIVFGTAFGGALHSSLTTRSPSRWKTSVAGMKGFAAVAGSGHCRRNHDHAFAEFAAGDLAQDAMIQAAVALAWTAVDAVTLPALRSRLLRRAPP